MKRESTIQGFPTRVALLILVVFVQLLVFSCATAQKKEQAIVYSQKEEFRTNLGKIGILSASFKPGMEFRKPMTKGAAALRGVGKWGLFPIKMAFEHPFLDGAYTLIIISPVAAVVGGIVGAVEGESSAKIKRSDDALKGYLATLNFQEIMRERFLSTAREHTQYPFVTLEVQGPKTLDEEVTYDSLLYRDIDTVLEIRVRSCDLSGTRRAVHPYLYLHMVVGTRFIRIRDGKVLYSPNFTYESFDLNQFSGWAANNAQLFKEEVDRGFQFLAKRIMGAVYMIQRPPDPQPTEDLQN